jgi:hypothetical protein
LGEHNDIFRYTTDELRSIATWYVTNSEVTKFCLPTGSREPTSSSGKEAPSVVIIHNVRLGTKDGKRRRKQRPQGTTTTADYDEQGQAFN